MVAAGLQEYVTRRPGLHESLVGLFLHPAEKNDRGADYRELQRIQLISKCSMAPAFTKGFNSCENSG